MGADKENIEIDQVKNIYIKNPSSRTKRYYLIDDGQGSLLGGGGVLS